MTNKTDLKDRIRAELATLEKLRSDLYERIAKVSANIALLSKYVKTPKKRPAKKSEKKT